MTAAAATSRRPSLHPEAALLDPARHELALADAARRLGRELSAGEQRIDLVRLDRDLAAGKERLVAAIESERRSAASRFAREAVAGRSPRMRLHLSPTIRRALRGLYDAGRSAGRGELARAGYDPDRLPRALAAVPARLAVIEERVDGRLAELGVADEHRLAVAFDLSAATRGEIMGAVARLPGVRAIAADFTSVPAFAGLGSVWDEADAAGITTAWTYTAVMDDGTCDTCSGFDGETYDSWDAIQEVLPDGGPNPDCDGGDRCRCRAVPEFGDQGSTGGATGDGGGGGFPAIGPDEAPPLPDSSAILDSIPGAERVPASEAASIAPGPDLAVDVTAVATRASRSLDSVVSLPEPIKVVPLPDADTATARLLSSGEIAVGPGATENDVIHEVGHYIDSRLLGTGIDSSGANIPDSLYQLMKNSPTMQAVRADEFRVLEGDAQMRNYFLQGREMFARAFDQYVAERSGDPELLARIERVLDDPLLSFQYWPHDEFEPIRAEITRILRERDLLRRRARL